MYHTHDEPEGLWYFGDSGDVCRTTQHRGLVNIDWDHYGNVLGVEFLEDSPDND